MDRSKNGSWTRPLKKFSGIRVKRVTDNKYSMGVDISK